MVSLMRRYEVKMSLSQCARCWPRWVSEGVSFSKLQVGYSVRRRRFRGRDCYCRAVEVRKICQSSLTSVKVVLEVILRGKPEQRHSLHLAATHSTAGCIVSRIPLPTIPTLHAHHGCLDRRRGSRSHHERRRQRGKGDSRINALIDYTHR